MDPLIGIVLIIVILALFVWGLGQQTIIQEPFKSLIIILAVVAAIYYLVRYLH